MNLVSGNIRFMGIFAGVPLSGGVKWPWGCRRRQFLAICVATSSETSEIRPPTSNITWLYATPCRPVIDCKMNDLLALSANFTSKSVFDQQGCRALTFVLARLSRFRCGVNLRNSRPEEIVSDVPAVNSLNGRCDRHCSHLVPCVTVVTA